MAMGLIVGSGFTELELPAHTQRSVLEDMDTPYGPASSGLERWSRPGGDVLLINRHGNPHRIAPHDVNYRANLWLLAQHQVTGVSGVQYGRLHSRSNCTGRPYRS